MVSPLTRYRYGEHTATTRAAHTADSRQWRRRLADAAFPPEDRDVVVQVARQLGDVAAAARAAGCTIGQVWGRARRDPDFAAALDAALAESCVAGARCGTERGYRARGRCARCRNAKNATRGTPAPRRRGGRTTARRPVAIPPSDGATPDRARPARSTGASFGIGRASDPLLRLRRATEARQADLRDEAIRRRWVDAVAAAHRSRPAGVTVPDIARAAGLPHRQALYRLINPDAH